MDRKEKIFSEEIEYSVKKISQWYRKNTKTLSIITSPFNNNYILEDVILEVLNNRKNVLYVWGQNGEDRTLIEELKKIKKNITYSTIDSGESKSNITFVNYKNIGNISGKYELTIFDDISNFSTLSKEALRTKYENLIKISNRMILYTIEPITTLGDKLEVAPICSKNPFVEPRFITTRIDLNKDIPYILYDYLKWFRDKRKNIIIYVPSKEKLSLVYDYYANKLKIEGVKVIAISRRDDKKNIKNVLKIKDKATFIITDFMEESLKDLKIDNAIVLFSDDEKYNYKKFLYLCGEIGKININLPEVLFVSREVSEEMEIAKDMARDFNKKIWEKRLMKL
ncbi:hypothetical protein [Clostridium sp. LP20]|uniref:hypothetical protein n=1 Tax=Clostridium sp. LP20 TaxID=3418665 RepID=UPI003EE4829E